VHDSYDIRNAKKKYPSQKSQIQALISRFNDKIKGIRPILKDSTDEEKNTIFSEDNYNVFSNITSAINHKGHHYSLESPHNAVHVFVGGDMGENETAGFDPIFFMHHSNVGNVIILRHYFHLPYGICLGFHFRSALLDLASEAWEN